MKIGAQLYTVREYMKTIDGFSETLKRVSDMGFKYVQVSGSCDYDADWLKKELEKNGLECKLTHYNPDKICSEPEKTVNFHNIFGCKYIGMGYFPMENYEKYKELLLKISSPAKIIKQKGSRLVYHNHNFEFENKRKPLLYMLCNDFSTEELGITLDVYWAKYAGFDPVEVIRTLGKSRVPCAHLKDLNPKTRLFDTLGDGELDFPEILKALEDIETEYAFIEQDDCFGKDPFECLKRSKEYLESLGYNYIYYI